MPRYALCLLPLLLVMPPTPALADFCTQEVSPAKPRLFNQLFTPEGPGWVGGDGGMSLKLHDGRTLWLFGDSFVEQESGSNNRKMVRNAFLVQKAQADKTCLNTIIKDRHSSLPGEGKSYYWPASAWEGRKYIFVFYHRYQQLGREVFNFHKEGSAIAILYPDSLTLKRVIDLPYPPRVLWGSNIIEVEGTLYLYGLEDESTIRYQHLARVPRYNLLRHSKWEFYNGKNWQAKEPKSARIAPGGVSAIDKGRKGYWLLSQVDGGFDRKVSLFRAKRPQGPWVFKKVVRNIPKGFKNEVVYIFASHPGWSTKRRLLVSYSFNSLADSQLGDPNRYGIRFFTVDHPGN